MKTNIKAIFDQQALLNDEEWELFSNHLTEVYFEKGEVILDQGQIEKYLTFIVHGTARMYTIDEFMNEFSIEFPSDNCFCCSYGSFVTQRPSNIGVEALEPIKAYRISYDDLQFLYNKSHTGERLGRINAELFLAHKEEREIMLLTLNAKQRYLSLISSNPKILNLVKLEHIATYLGITPQSLSRIRNNIRIN